MFYLNQDILPSRPPSIPVHQFSSRGRLDAAAMLRSFTGTKYLGVSLHISPEGHVHGVAFATPEEAVFVALGPSPHAAHSEPNATRARSVNGNWNGNLAGGGGGGDMHLTEVSSHTLVGFSMARIALHLSRDHGWHTRRGVDMSTLFAQANNRAWTPAELLDVKVGASSYRNRVNKLWYPDEEDQAVERTCLRAWITAVCAASCHGEVAAAASVDTSKLKQEHLRCLGNLVLGVHLLEARKPLVVENEFKAIVTADGGILLENARFKNRVRQSRQTSIVLSTPKGSRLIGKAVTAEGKKTTIHITQGVYRGGDLKSVSVHGREEPTSSEVARDAFFLRLLQAGTSLSNRLFIDCIWFPELHIAHPKPPRHPVPDSTAFSRLNDSQRMVAAAMISPSQPLVITHGPPGTGKTSTIASAVMYWLEEGKKETIWIVAQSNIGVKNIARSFVEKGAQDFKLIVSKEFYVEWHEHIYTAIEGKLVRTDEMGLNFDAATYFRDTRVVLCTLAMLSNPALDTRGVFDAVPLDKLVVDEASQIDIAEYMHLLHKFKYLQKLCLFGDPKQLPPYGSDSVRSMQSIFDVKHLKASAYFLNTQYRMPVPLGQFISREVYNSKLQSTHNTTSSSCVTFVDVAKGVEQSRGKSWVNVEEANMVVSLVRDYYRHKDYCVITPYDAQRAEIQRALESANLPSDRVYNVDSFQGHEAKYVILSIVRTHRPGFLSVQSRSNVMLTRCQEGMVIVANKRFVESSARHTLLGMLAAEWRTKHAYAHWVDWRHVFDKTAVLPGFARMPLSAKPVLSANQHHPSPLPVNAPVVQSYPCARDPTVDALALKMHVLQLGPSAPRSMAVHNRGKYTLARPGHGNGVERRVGYWE